jgi:osmoprotectant transport system permease protein
VSGVSADCGTATCVQHAPAGRLRGAGAIHNHVLLVLLTVALAAVLQLAFVTVTANRLVSGTGVALPALMHGARWWLLGPAAVLCACVALPSATRTHAAAALAAASLLIGLVWLAGDEAARQSANASRLSRVSLGGGLWVALAMAWLAAVDASQRLATLRRWTTTQRLLASLGLLALVAFGLMTLLRAGELDALSLLKEYANRHDAFEAAAWQHLRIVGSTLAAALLMGVPWGIAAARHARLARPLVALLSLAQTVPSVALFGLLIAPLAWLGQALPGLGVSGVGMLPAVLALTLYALLPIVLGTASGLQQVPAGVRQAAAGMGLTRGQVFRQVELPLALPVLLSALRVAAVQVVGLAVLAALIGAGGFGGLVFQGLFSSAIDLVLLGVLPVVLTALLVDAAFALLAVTLAARRP